MVNCQKNHKKIFDLKHYTHIINLFLFVEFNLIFLLEVGDGWSPALIKDEVQLDFITAAMKYVSGSWSYWIGGSTCSEQPVPLSLYCRCNNTGDKILAIL